MKKVLFLFMCLALVSILQADIISFDAEDAGLISVAGTNWRTEAAAGASGGLVITPDAPHGDPVVEAEIRNYMFDIGAGSYTLYARVNKRDGIYDGWGTGESFWNDSAWLSDSSFAADAAMYKWNSMIPDTGLDGVATLNNFGWISLPLTYVQAADGTAYFRAAPREPLLIDAFAFVTTGQAVTDAELNRTLGIPEPATMVLLGLGSLVALKRRK